MPDIGGRKATLTGVAATLEGTGIRSGEHPHSSEGAAIEGFLIGVNPNSNRNPTSHRLSHPKQRCRSNISGVLLAVLTFDGAHM